MLQITSKHSPAGTSGQRIPTAYISASPLFAKPRGLPALCFLVTFSPLGLMSLGGSSKVGFPGGGGKEGGSGEKKPADRQPRASSTLPGASWGGGHMVSTLWLQGGGRETESSWAPRRGLSSVHLPSGNCPRGAPTLPSARLPCCLFTPR